MSNNYLDQNDKGWVDGYFDGLLSAKDMVDKITEFADSPESSKIALGFIKKLLAESVEGMNE